MAKRKKQEWSLEQRILLLQTKIDFKEKITQSIKEEIVKDQTQLDKLLREADEYND